MGFLLLEILVEEVFFYFHSNFHFKKSPPYGEFFILNKNMDFLINTFYISAFCQIVTASPCPEDSGTSGSHIWA